MWPLGTGDVTQTLCILCLKVKKTLTNKRPFTLLATLQLESDLEFKNKHKKFHPTAASAQALLSSCSMCWTLLFATVPLLHIPCPDTDTHGDRGCFHACGITIATISPLPERLETLQCSVLRMQRGNTITLYLSTHHKSHMCIHTQPLLKDITMRSRQQIRMLTPSNTKSVQRQKGGKTFLIKRYFVGYQFLRDF